MVFRVDRHANKVQIKNAVQTVFKVQVGRAYCNFHGKTRRRGRYAFGVRPDWKKAISGSSPDRRCRSTLKMSLRTFSGAPGTKSRPEGLLSRGIG